MTNSGHWGDAYRAGVAVVTLAGFLAEVGDLSGYEYRQQIIRLAGLNLKENSSGKKKSKSEGKPSKEGVDIQSAITGSIHGLGTKFPNLYSRHRLHQKILSSLHDFSISQQVNG
ncbi:hypothetical protein CA600_22725 [Paenibacillus sp. VTT E-133280]|uniref:IS110 family transposase n=1 Tax=unclassified Paenibacillus TaxID=185978 RepID=UPI000BDDC40B|nr:MULTISPECIES: IS110 family transposase [unclassified Paenibacillus]MDH6373089.1 hypothetical protein [Paenibacillus sp. PastF-3]OZQ62250.1 hypothetical protein CA600_22725 [Paenibacillus sp. VTT E-133280]OZQ77749.1 hypothetical protein CA598_29585 [Paenibacillus sp. VTT E-133291]